MLGAQARFIPEINHQESNPILSRDSNSNPDSAEQPLRRNNNFKPQPQPQLDSRSLDSNPIRFNPRSPAPTSLPRPRDEPNHLRLSNRDFQKGLQKRNLQKQRRKGSPTDYDLLIGPFHASNEEDVKEKKRGFLQGRENGGIKRWVEGQQVELKRNAIEHLHGGFGEFEIRRGDQMDLDSRDLLGEEQEELELRGQEDESYSDWVKRQTQAEQTCFVGNEHLSCYPTTGTEVVQDRWSKFIWNSNYPRFAQIGYVDVYLFRQDQDMIQTSWTSLDNNEGRLSFSPTDSYWEGRDRADNIESGQNITWPFYFVVTYAGAGLDGTTDRQSTWSAIQTALPVAIASSRSEASVSASRASASLASASATLTGAAASSASASEASVSSSLVASLSRELVSSLQAEGLTGTETLQGTLTTTLSNGQVVTATATGQANGSLSDAANDDNGGGGLPKYAIALIVVFGFLALVAALVGLYFAMAAMRRRKNRDESMGSRSPMMRGVDGDGLPSSSIAPSLDAGTIGAGGAAGAAGLLAANRRSRSTDDDQLFTSDEATRMADAFRAALRKPEFANPFGQNQKDESGGDDDDDTPGEESGKGNELLRSELATEGYEVRPVQDRRRAELHDGED